MEENFIKTTASIVLYNNNFEELKKLINNILKSDAINIVYLVDNSFTDRLKSIQNLSSRITYVFNSKNLGFGAGHNIAMKLAIENHSQYHFVLNPDVNFDDNVLGSMVNYMIENNDVGMLMPRILNDDDTMQFLPKLLPSPFSIFMRKFKRPDFYYKKYINKYELRFVDENTIYNAPVLSGCCTLLSLKAIKELGGYDDRFFMYFEDWDLSRRIHMKYRTLYYPSVFVNHGYESGANKSFKLFKIYIKSMISYFNKWGWFFDKERKRINREALDQFLL